MAGLRGVNQRKEMNFYRGQKAPDSPLATATPGKAPPFPRHGKRSEVCEKNRRGTAAIRYGALSAWLFKKEKKKKGTRTRIHRRDKFPRDLPAFFSARPPYIFLLSAAASVRRLINGINKEVYRHRAPIADWDIGFVIGENSALSIDEDTPDGG